MGGLDLELYWGASRFTWRRGNAMCVGPGSICARQPPSSHRTRVRSVFLLRLLRNHARHLRNRQAGGAARRRMRAANAGKLVW